MTHRVALVLSLALTLALGAGVVVGRDRFFAPERNSSPAGRRCVLREPDAVSDQMA